MITKKLFLASSAELKEDRRDFEVFINRKNKDWAASDKARDAIAACGWEIKDTPQGPKVKKK